MTITRRIRSQSLAVLVASFLCLGAGRFAAQGATTAPSKEQADDAAAFKRLWHPCAGIRQAGESRRRHAARSETDRRSRTDRRAPTGAGEKNPGGQAQGQGRRSVHARRHRSVSPRQPAARGAERRRLARVHAVGRPQSRDALVGERVYPDTEPITPLSPALLAAFPPLPAEVAYRIVDRTLLLVDVKSRLIVDFARGILPPA